MESVSDILPSQGTPITRKYKVEKFIFTSGGFLIDFCVIWPLIFCAFSFTLFFSIHPNSRDKVEGYRQIPTLSQTGKLVPESLFFTYGLHTEGALLAILFTMLYAHYSYKIAEIQSKRQYLLEDYHDEEDGLVNENPKEERSLTLLEGVSMMCCCCCMPQRSLEDNVPFLQFWNKVLWIIGMACSLFMTLVGTVTLDVETDIHGVLAFFMYITAILHMLIHYYTLAETMGQTPFQLTLHRVCLVVCIPFNICMMVLISVMLGTCGEGSCMEAAIDLIVVLEYTTTLGLLGYIYRFREDLKDFNLIAMTRDSSSSSSSGERVQHTWHSPQQQHGQGQGGVDSGYTPPGLASNTTGTTSAAGATTTVERDRTAALVNLLI